MAPPALPTTAMPCAMASSAARGVTSIQRGVLREGTTTTSSRGQTSSTALRGRAPRQVTRPAMPSRSARPSSSSCAGPVPTTVSVHRPTSFTAARKSRSRPFSGISRPTKPEAQSGVRGALDRERQRHAELGDGAVRQRRMARERQPAGQLVDRDDARRAGERAVPAEPRASVLRLTRQALAREDHVRDA